MSKNTGNRVAVEAWNVKSTAKGSEKNARQVIAKVAVRNSKGQFHGATNFKGSVIG